MSQSALPSHGFSIPQTEPPRSPRETLPTMYDLPSENAEEPGLPDEYHYLQPQLLSATLRIAGYEADQIFSVGDMNLYYDVRHPNWYKRPDWFAVVGVPRLYDGRDLRLSYVTWQEGVNPFIVVELLSPGTEREDLGQTKSRTGIPTKWDVYEQILRVPYYIIFNRYTDEFQAFQLVGGQYQPLPLSNSVSPDSQPDDHCRIWIAEWQCSLGTWDGTFQGVTRRWLRWYDEQGNLILTSEEELSQAETRASQAEQRAEMLAQRLRDLGVDPNQV